MKEIHGNIWQVEADAICITTNGDLKKNGRAIMGKGLAKQTVEHYPNIDIILGLLIKKYGNLVHMLTGEYGLNNKVPMLCCTEIGEVPDADGIITPWHIVSLPTKRSWRDRSNISFIIFNLGQLSYLAQKKKWKKIVLPRPGCGLGGLIWHKIKPILTPLMDDRFFIINNEARKSNDNL